MRTRGRPVGIEHDRSVRYAQGASRLWDRFVQHSGNDAGEECPRCTSSEGYEWCGYGEGFLTGMWVTALTFCTRRSS